MNVEYDRNYYVIWDDLTHLYYYSDGYGYGYTKSLIKASKYETPYTAKAMMDNLDSAHPKAFEIHKIKKILIDESKVIFNENDWTVESNKSYD